MTHNITLTESEFNSIANGKRHIITRDKGLFATGDALTVTKSGSRKQMEFTITDIETERMFKGWCVLGFNKPQAIAINTRLFDLVEGTKENFYTDL